MDGHTRFGGLRRFLGELTTGGACVEAVNLVTLDV